MKMPWYLEITVIHPSISIPVGVVMFGNSRVRHPFISSNGTSKYKLDTDMFSIVYL